MKARYRVISRVLILALVTAAFAELSAASAQAAPCPSGKHIFIRAGSTTNRWGVRGKIEVPVRQINACSVGAAYTTVHLTNCALQCGTQVEIGTIETDNQISVFTEKELNGVDLKFDIITTAAYNTLTDYRVKVAQSGDTFFEYNFGGGWTTTWSSPYNVSWAPGYPMGESEKLATTPR